MRTTSTFVLCSTLLLLLLLSSVSVSARSVPALHHDVDDVDTQHEHMQPTDETAAAADTNTISIKITKGHRHESARDHHDHDTHHHHSRHNHVKSESVTSETSESGTTCTLEQCKVRVTDTNVNICGSDGKVYFNDCLFRNAQCNKLNSHGIVLSSVPSWDGNHCPSTCTKPIVCQENAVYLCGTDGNVYFGYCRLYEAQCVDPALQEIACPPGFIEFPSRGRRY